ncbi:MAG: hypothetical protein AB8G16_19805 [Gammaproteobacteria bacterium]
MNPRDDLFDMTPRSEPYVQNGTLKNMPDWGPGFMELRARDVAAEINQWLNA